MVLGSGRGPRIMTVVAIVLAALGLLMMVPGGSERPARAQPRGRDKDVVKDVVFAIHGGAGPLRREDFTPELEAEYRGALTEAVRRGYDVINNGGDGVEATERAITFFEDSPLFNAGKGAVFTTDGANELDSSIMDGSNLDAGAVTGVTHIKNPISLARELMENSRHLMLAGYGAELYPSTGDSNS
jgi:L-asparaginase / beta-aspartyl-peptidase